MDKMRLLDLFSGIGGFSLGLERSGYFETVAFCEIEEYPRRVLKKHWPKVPCYGDIRELDGNRLVRECGRIDAICGGFPCQDISTAGKGAGIGGSRSGLWKEYARIIGEIRPRYVIVENVSALLARGMGTVLADLSEIGYDAEWRIISAASVGAPHRRDRVWIVAYPNGRGHKSANRREIRCPTPNGEGSVIIRRSCQKNLADAPSERRGEARKHCERSKEWTACGCDALANAASFGCSGSGEFIVQERQAPRFDWKAIESVSSGLGSIWATEPNVGRVANGVSRRVDRLKGLGNAVVPQIPELIGRAIGEYELDQIPTSPVQS